MSTLPGGKSKSSSALIVICFVSGRANQRRFVAPSDHSSALGLYGTSDDSGVMVVLLEASGVREEVWRSRRHWTGIRRHRLQREDPPGIAEARVHDGHEDLAAWISANDDTGAPSKRSSFAGCPGGSVSTSLTARIRPSTNRQMLCAIQGWELGAAIDDAPRDRVSLLGPVPVLVGEQGLVHRRRWKDALKWEIERAANPS